MEREEAETRRGLALGEAESSAWNSDASGCWKYWLEVTVTSSKG